MEQKPKKMDIVNMIRATEDAKARVKGWLDLAEQVASDTRKAERLSRQECKGCFYASRFGGAAITRRACMSCGEDQMYGSTATDVLCIECAKQHDLCAHCGGDIKMRVRRKQWPV